jgi:hypothetical protein
LWGAEPKEVEPAARTNLLDPAACEAVVDRTGLDQVDPVDTDVRVQQALLRMVLTTMA